MFVSLAFCYVFAPWRFSPFILGQVEGHDISFPRLPHPCAYCFDSLGRAQFEEATSTFSSWIMNLVNIPLESGFFVLYLVCCVVTFKIFLWICTNTFYWKVGKMKFCHESCIRIILTNLGKYIPNLI